MIKNILILASFVFNASCVLQAQHKKPENETPRKIWLRYLDKISRPVLFNLSEDKLKGRMTVELSQSIDQPSYRTEVSYLEAFGRTLCGIAPWLNLEGGTDEEAALRNQYRQWTLKAIANAVNPSAKDYLKWTGGQPLVDASFFAFGLVRCPWLWEHLDTITKQRVIVALKTSRSTVPAYNNWILFSAMIESVFCKYGLDYDAVRIEYAIREFVEHWYLGDGTFSDGMEYHNNYYNSFVIQPYLAAIIEIINKKNNAYGWLTDKQDKISKRYAEIQERLINADGSFPVTGRSITYRGAAFHHLANMALLKQLPSSLKPAQVRDALTAVIKKTLEHPATFTKEGWLNIGLYGYQPALADTYITTGSLYICTTVFLPLGLPETDEFWMSPPAPWTSVKVWSGENTTPADHGLDSVR